MLGTLLGLIAGYVGGWAETIIMSLVDIQLSLPFMVLSLAVIAAVGPGLGNVVVLLIITQWVVFARVVRGLVLSLKEEDFVLAARALGATGLHIARRHVLPNCWGPILALAIPSVAGMIIAEAALSFLGLGVRPPTPTWGGMLSDARVYLHQAPWFAVLAGVPIVITVLGINLLGDWSRGHLDPRQRRKR
jgi:peptide/nickel transport system permease protein